MATQCCMGLPALCVHITLTVAASQDGWAALRRAVSKGNEGVARVLLEAGADTNLQDQACVWQWCERTVIGVLDGTGACVMWRGSGLRDGVMHPTLR